MLENTLGIITLWTFVTCISFYAFSRVALKFNMRPTEKGQTYIGSYAASIILFMFISSVILLLINTIETNKLPKPLTDSGLMFALILLLSGYLIRFSYWFFFKVIGKITKSPNYYSLSPTEMTTSWLLLCIVYLVVFLFSSEYTIACTYGAIIVANFFWIGTDCSSLKCKIKETFNLSRSYFYVIIFLCLNACIVLRYNTHIEICLAVLGMIIGIVAALLLSGFHDQKK